MIKDAIVLAVLIVTAGQAFAHGDTVGHTESKAAGLVSSAEPPSDKGLRRPLDLGGPFTLTDQTGAPRTEVDPKGNLQLLFFGYANCREICSVTLPQMAEVEQGLAARGVAMTPVMITVDPARDTVETLGPALRQYSPNFVGLTGDAPALSAAYKAFSIESGLVFEDPFTGPVYAHGSFLYLLDAKGGFLTVIPPILSTDRVVDVIANYAP